MLHNQKLFVALLLIWVVVFSFYITTTNWCCAFQKNAFVIQRHLYDAVNFIEDSHINLKVSESKLEELVSDVDFKTMTHNEIEDHVNHVCAADDFLPSSLEQLTKKQKHILLSHLVVNDEYKFMYCYTPKVACSNWKKVIKTLYGNLQNEDFHRMDHKHGFTYLSDYDDPEIEKRLRSYFKFTFVRNPTQRALSVYRNKFNEIESFYTVYGSKIAEMYHKKSPEYKGKVPGDDVTFPDFLQYIATGVEAEDMNEHFMPLATLCQPCVINYTFIGVYDNIDEESEIVLKSIKAPDHVHFPARQNWYKPTTDTFMHYYYSLITSSLLNDFVSKYSLDFSLFSFPKPFFSGTNRNRTLHYQ